MEGLRAGCASWLATAYSSAADSSMAGMGQQGQGGGRLVCCSITRVSCSSVCSSSQRAADGVSVLGAFSRQGGNQLQGAVDGVYKNCLEDVRLVWGRQCLACIV